LGSFVYFWGGFSFQRCRGRLFFFTNIFGMTDMVNFQLIWYSQIWPPLGYSFLALGV
jgi:hypothetical protein